jgi:hypothetical protein
MLRRARPSRLHLAIVPALGRSCTADTDDFTGDPEKVPVAQPCPAWWKRWLEGER